MVTRRRSIAFTLSLLLPGALTAGGAAAQPIEVSDAWVRLATGDQSQPVAYFTIINHGEADRLLEVSSSVCEKVSLNSTRWHGTSATFGPVATIAVPGVNKVILKPGGYGAVLVNPVEPLRVGQIVPLSLRFEHAGTLNVDAKVSNQLLGNRGR